MSIPLTSPFSTLTGFSVPSLRDCLRLESRSDRSGSPVRDLGSGPTVLLRLRVVLTADLPARESSRIV